MSALFRLGFNRVSLIMAKTLLALIPGIAIASYFLGIGLIVQVVLASISALVFEAAMLKLRHYPIKPFLKDGSALLTAWLIALALPPLGAWWMVIVASFFAIVVAKHLYGGLGNNPFNPAMVGFAVMIIAFPQQMANWGNPLHALSAWDQIQYIFTRQVPGHFLDAINSATPLDNLKTQLLMGHESVSNILSGPSYGYIAGIGSEWVALGFLLGGLFLLQQKIIQWRTPVAVLLGVTLVTLPLWLYQPDRFASPVFHLLAGATMLGAFFIATDPVTSPTTPIGQIIFGIGIGILIVVIRVFGGFPDAIAFAVLVMNIAVPLIDRTTQPKTFGRKGETRHGK